MHVKEIQAKLNELQVVSAETFSLLSITAGSSLSRHWSSSWQLYVLILRQQAERKTWGLPWAEVFLKKFIWKIKNIDLSSVVCCHFIKVGQCLKTICSSEFKNCLCCWIWAIWAIWAIKWSGDFALPIVTVRQCIVFLKMSHVRFENTVWIPICNFWAFTISNSYRHMCLLWNIGNVWIRFHSLPHWWARNGFLLLWHGSQRLGFSFNIVSPVFSTKLMFNRFQLDGRCL